MNAIAPIAERPRPAHQVVEDVIPMLDTGRFEHMQRIAAVMARTSLIPEALRTYKDHANNIQDLPFEAVLANSFLVVNQSVRWGMDPFAVAQCVSIVKGKLCYEGKLVAAVLDAKLGIELTYTYDDKPGEQLGIVVSGVVNGVTKTVEGTVAAWKTTGAGSPWSLPTYKRQLAYRGSREWARMHKPALMLGAYTEDELADLSEASRSNNARDVTHRAITNPLADNGPARIAPTVTATVEPAADPAPATVASPDDVIAELERRFRAAKSSAEIEAAFSEVTLGNKLYEAKGFMDRARALKAEYLAKPATKPKKLAAEDATIIISETAAGAPPPGQPAAQDAGAETSRAPSGEAPASDDTSEIGISPDDEIANLIDKLAHAKDEATIEEWYAETDIEAALGDFTGYVEKARAAKAQQIDRVNQAAARAAALAATTAETAPPPPSASSLADDDEGPAPPPRPAEAKGFDPGGWRAIEAKQPYIGYAKQLAEHAKAIGDADLISTFWKASKDLRTKLIDEADERLTLLKSLNAVIDEINAANGAANGA